MCSIAKGDGGVTENPCPFLCICITSLSDVQNETIQCYSKYVERMVIAEKCEHESGMTEH